MPKRVAWLVALGSLLSTPLAPAAGQASAAQTGSVERLSWMMGCWELRAGGRMTTEMWMPPAGGMMLGGSRTIVDGSTREYENLRISARGDTLVYTALPSGQTETHFRSSSVTASEVVFENRAHDFPQVIRYRRVGTDSLVARIEGPGANNTTRGSDFRMRRVSCTEVSPAPPPDSIVMDAEYAPGGAQLVVVKGVSGNFDLHVGTGPGALRPITDHAAIDYQPAWSPTAQLIAFVSVREGHQEIYTVRPDGSGLTQLTRGSAHNSEPAWSPDGRVIAFRSERGGRPQIYRMNADGSDQRALTSDSTGAGAPAWSPDGRRILFSSSLSGRGEIYAMNPDGSARTRLTETPQGHSGLAQWSPDGRTIAFWTSRDGNDEVYLMAADGSDARNVTGHAARDFPVGWTPDGRFILFRSTRDRPLNEIYRIQPDGTGVSRITTTGQP